LFEVDGHVSLEQLPDNVVMGMRSSHHEQSAAITTHCTQVRLVQLRHI